MMELTEGFLLKHLRTGYSLAQVRAFLDGLFVNGNKELAAASIPITCDGDFIMLILAVIRQNERGLPYTVEMQEGRVERNGYYIPNMVIRKQEGESFVERDIRDVI
jgi:hypothetical protein